MKLSLNKIKCIFIYTTLFILFFTIHVSIYAAQGVPTTLSYQGKLTDSGGNPLGAGGTDYYFKFSIWDNPTPGQGIKLWPTSSPNSTILNVKQGSFGVNVGDTDGGYPDVLDYNFNTNNKVYLQVEVSGDNTTFETLAPRSLISSNAFSQVANSVNGTADSSFGTSTPFLNTLISVLSTNINKAVMTIKGAVGQVANLFNVKDSNDNSLFTVTADGKVGVGTTSPLTALHVYKTGASIRVQDSATTIRYLDIIAPTNSDTNSYIQSIQSPIVIDSGNSTGAITLKNFGQEMLYTKYNSAMRLFNSKMVIDTTGNVGIGTTTPGSKLDVWGNLNVGTSSTSVLFVNTTNNFVGIGTNSQATSTAKLSLGGAMSWVTGLGSMTHILGPNDQALSIAARVPDQQASSVAGNSLNLSASDGVAGLSVVGAVVGGSLNLVAGNASSLTSGNANGGAISLRTGNATGYGAPGSMLLTLGTAPNGFSPNSYISLVTPNDATPAKLLFTTGNSTKSDSSGGNGGDVSFSQGYGGSIYSSGGTAFRGGQFSVTTGIGGGGGYNSGTQKSGPGGNINFTSGAGGDVALPSGTGIASSSGSFNLNIGRGGNVTGTTGIQIGGSGGNFIVSGGSGGDVSGINTSTAGNGSTLTLTSGSGGSATGVSGIRTGGNSGNIVLDIGAAGTGATASGLVGNVLLASTRGFVGIGTTTPGSKLDVWGNLQVGTSSTPALFVNTATGNSTISGGLTSLSYNLTGVVGGGLIYQQGTKIEISESWKGINFQSFGPRLGGVVQLGPNTFTVNGDITTNASSSTYTAAGNIILSPGGNVGVGTTTPVARLSVKGSGTGTGLLTQFTDSANVARFTVLDNGDVGVGTSTPSYKLDINGSGRVSGIFYLDTELKLGNDNSVDTPNITFGNNGSGYGAVLDKNGQDFNFYFGRHSSQTSARLSFFGNTSSGALVTFNGTGSVGIGTTTPLDKLQVFGDIRLGTTGSNGCIKDYAGTGITGTCSSDERLKTNVVDLSDGYLDKMANLKVISYQWNDTARDLNKVDTSVTNYGLLAQNVEQNFPELVSVDSNGYKQINYSRIPLYLLKSIQELTKKVIAFSDEFRTKKLCIGDTCINEDQLKMLLQNQNVQSSQPTPDTAPAVVSETDSESILEPTQIPQPVTEPVVIPIVETETTSTSELTPPSAVEVVVTE